jgi:phenylalanyl-tRNA synthetase alpha subunit
MRGGKNKKTIQEHLANGTYRPSLHGQLNQSDEETLKEMKDELYKSFRNFTNEMKKLDLNKNDELEKYDSLSKKRNEFIKTFHSIAKTPIEEKLKETVSDGGKLT